MGCTKIRSSVVKALSKWALLSHWIKQNTGWKRLFKIFHWPVTALAHPQPFIGVFGLVQPQENRSSCDPPPSAQVTLPGSGDHPLQFINLFSFHQSQVSALLTPSLSFLQQVLPVYKCSVEPRVGSLQGFQEDAGFADLQRNRDLRTFP